MGYAPPYYLRLRIYARQVNYFYRKLRGLAPVYDSCPVRCLAPEADRPNGCPDCDFTIAYNAMRKNYARIVEKDVRRGLLERGVDVDKATRLAKESIDSEWSYREIEADYRSLSELEAMAGVETSERPGRYDPTWNIRTRTAIDIIREERYNVRREKEYEAKLEAEARERARRR